MRSATRSGSRRHPATILIFVLPVLLLVAAAVLGITMNQRQPERPMATGPLALPPVDAPDAASPTCARLVAALPNELTASPNPLPRLALAAPAPAGAAAWAGTDPTSPVVLRCGLPRPPELVPTSALIVVNGVSWLPITEADRDTFVAVDRPVYLAVTVSRALGTGPLQTISDTVKTTLPPR